VSFVDDVLYRYRKHPESLTADSRVGLEQMQKLIDYHLADPRTPREIELRRRALSRRFDFGVPQRDETVI
jgi:hypothetical protein